MEIKKHISLTADEVLEALTEYLSKRNIAYELDSINIYSDEDGLFTNADVIGN